jgi:hypothetical protein
MNLGIKRGETGIHPDSRNATLSNHNLQKTVFAHF